MIDAYIITLKSEESQLESTKRLVKSIEKSGSEITPFSFDATTPSRISIHLQTQFDYFDWTSYKWSWPENKSSEEYCLKSGLYKPMYQANNQRKVEACLISHMRLWEKCFLLDTPIIILESDSLFTRKFSVKDMDNCNGEIVGLNDPRGATRRSQIFHERVSMCEGFHNAPTVNKTGERCVPQGIAGNSAYYIKPYGAKVLLDLIMEFGGWPNDAIMCKELLNNKLKVVYPYYTKVQGTKSTTTG